MNVIFQMKQQQLAMQEQMTRLMAQSIPTEQQTLAQLRKDWAPGDRGELIT